MITISPNDHVQEVATFGVGRTQHVCYTQAIASTYVLIRANCTYWNKAGYLHKLLPQLAAALQVFIGPIEIILLSVFIQIYNHL